MPFTPFILQTLPNRQPPPPPYRLPQSTNFNIPTAIKDEELPPSYSESVASEPPPFLKENQTFSLLVSLEQLSFLPKRPEEINFLDGHLLWESSSEPGSFGFVFKNTRDMFLIPKEKITPILQLIAGESNQKIMFSRAAPEGINFSCHVLRPSKSKEGDYVLHVQGTDHKLLMPLDKMLGILIKMAENKIHFLADN